MEIQQQAVAENGAAKSFMLRHVTAIDIFAGIIIMALVMSNVYMYTMYRDTRAELSGIQNKQAAVKINEGVLNFTGLFIEKVLKAEGEIDFETRLKLESAVRALNDDTILVAWQRFTNSATEKDAQDAVKNLLGILVNKVQ